MSMSRRSDRSKVHKEGATAIIGMWIRPDGRKPDLAGKAS